MAHVSGIYMIRNTVSGRIYVGSSYRIRQRWGAHRHELRTGKHHSLSLQRSWNKHGERVFTFSILEVVNRAQDLFIREQFWIDLLDASSSTRGFNVHPKAGGPRGHKLSSEIRARQSVMRLGRKLPPFSEAHREALRQSKLGTKASLETRIKMSALRKGKKLNVDRRGQKRGPFSRDHRAAIARAVARASWLKARPTADQMDDLFATL